MDAPTLVLPSSGSRDPGIGGANRQECLFLHVDAGKAIVSCIVAAGIRRRRHIMSAWHVSTLIRHLSLMTGQTL